MNDDTDAARFRRLVEAGWLYYGEGTQGGIWFPPGDGPAVDEAEALDWLARFEGRAEG